MPARTVLVFLDAEPQLRSTPLVRGFVEGVESHDRGEVVMISGGADSRDWKRTAKIVRETCKEKMRRGEVAAYVRLARNRGRADYAELASFRPARFSRELVQYLLKPFAGARFHGAKDRFQMEYLEQDRESRPWADAMIKMAEATEWRVAVAALLPWFADVPQQQSEMVNDSDQLHSMGVAFGTACGHFVNRWS